MNECKHVFSCWGQTRLGDRGLVPTINQNTIRGFIDVAGEDVRKCPDLPAGRCPITKLLSYGFDGSQHYRSLVPARYAQARFDTILKELVDTGRQELVDHITNQVVTWENADISHNMWVHGVAGVGRSWLAAALLHRWTTNGMSCLWLPWQTLSTNYSGFVTMSGATAANRFYEATSRNDVLIVDDFCAFNHDSRVLDFFMHLLVGILENGTTRLVLTSTSSYENFITERKASDLETLLLRKIKPITVIHYSGTSR